MLQVWPFAHRLRAIPRFARSTTSGFRSPTAPGCPPTCGSPRRPSVEPVPAIVEVSPYRHEDNTRRRDAVRHPYFAGRGYASLRIDIRGSGSSDGVLLDEYSEREQLDVCEALAWVGSQPWSTGSVGMIGLSWGGFAALQAAAAARPS